MIKIYTDTRYLTPEFRKIIFPVLLDIHFLKTANALSNFQLVDELETADVVLVPVAINYFFKHKKQQELNQFIDKAIALNKKVWVYAAGDFGITFRKDVTVFRLGGFKSKLSENEEILPSFVSDAYSTILTNNWKPLPKSIKPEIGFVGHANNSKIQLVKEFVLHLKFSVNRKITTSLGDYQSFYPSSLKRFEILEKIKKSDVISTNFILRKLYRAGVKSEEDKQKTSLEFYKNIENNLYTVCIRGAGNFSVRLYETLMMGRIPVVIASDAKLPLENYIDWEKHIVVTNSENILKDLVVFHEKSSNEALIEIQKNNRNLMLELFQRVNYFAAIYKFKNEF
ncbi:exostosin domain-containing protein [Flavobacterium facile]|uniref:exostosin domain-containing protein n=1 Tax=Flavobacterium facile TaxID=2893174 RepID=UPI002E78A7F5|nr:exostosin family protein [Flavobacterium sp. T-12]